MKKKSKLYCEMWQKSILVQGQLSKKFSIKLSLINYNRQAWYETAAYKQLKFSFYQLKKTGDTAKAASYITLSNWSALKTCPPKGWQEDSVNYKWRWMLDKCSTSCSYTCKTNVNYEVITKRRERDRKIRKRDVNNKVFQQVICKFEATYIYN